MSDYEVACKYLNELKNAKDRKEFERIVMQIPNLETAQIIIKKILRESD